MKHSFFAAILLAASSPAQVSTPRIGIAADAQGTLRTITGVAGNLIAGDALASGVLSSAASDTAIIIKSSSELRVITADGNDMKRRVSAGPALFAFSAAGSPELVWLSESRTLLRPCRRGFCASPLSTVAIQGDVVAVGASDAGHVNLAVTRNQGIEILHVNISDGAIAGVMPLAGALGAPLLMADGSVLYAVPGALVLRDRYGHERRTPFSHAPSSIVLMSSSWALVIAKAENRRFAVRLTDGAAFQIPEVR